MKLIFFFFYFRFSTVLQVQSATDLGSQSVPFMIIKLSWLTALNVLVYPSLIGMLQFVKMKVHTSTVPRGQIPVFWRLSADTCTYSLCTMEFQRLPLMTLFSVRNHSYLKHSTCIVQRGQIFYSSSPVSSWKVWCMHQWLHCVQRYRPMLVLQSEWVTGVQRTK